MDQPTLSQIVSFFSIGTNIFVLGLAIKFSRCIGRIEFQHELMWSDYQARTLQRRKTDLQLTDVEA